jgi:hydroxyethylthiazole kinase-like uncharacterized protein yjeF
VNRIDFALRHALYSVEATRRIELAAQESVPPHALMQRAGLALARLALALAPHSRRPWIACGPGNNGGDGMEAAMHLQQWGKNPVVTWLGSAATAPADALASWQRALNAGVQFSEEVPIDFDLGIDAMLGIGAMRAPEGRMAKWIDLLNASRSCATLLAVDIPTGLQADTGAVAPSYVKAHHCLSLLTLKPGLFFGHGRDAAGTVWLDDLQLAQSSSELITPAAWLGGAPHEGTSRIHASHKGSYGDVAIVGGAPGMTGAALLAASAALNAGAGRVFVGLLDGGSLSADTNQPELMCRPVETLDFKSMTVVCGCGGGDEIRRHLPKLLSSAAQLVIDADALNAIATDPQLQTLLTSRSNRFSGTVLTPHPLEAARLLGSTVAQVQGDRLCATRRLVDRFGCTVVLKGSGTVIAAPKQVPLINPTGNARLATAGTGDVLAGLIGAGLAAGIAAWRVSCEAVFQHGLQADRWPEDLPLTAAALARSLQKK